MKVYVSKIDANGFYGATGMSSCLFYNLNVAASTTSAGQSAISVAGMSFESFLANNVKFRSLSEITTYIINVSEENNTFMDHQILDKDIPVEMVFEKLITTCGHGYAPSEDDMEVAWVMLLQQPQNVLNRLFYKSNLFAFMANNHLEKLMISLLVKMEKPYLDPNDIPEEIEAELNVFWDILREYVFYNHGYIDRIDRLTYLPRKVTAVIDTDSNIIILDPWFKYWRDKVSDIPMRIKHIEEKIVPNVIEYDEYGDAVLVEPFDIIDPDLDFDFENDEIIELKRVMKPDKVLAEDALRFSIINILAYCLGEMVNEAMIDYTKHTGSYRETKKCRLIMKNEFLFKKLLITSAKKNYASIIELQEGKQVDNVLDMKGLSMMKSTLNKTAQDKLKNLLYEDILKDPNISPMKIVRKLRVIERQIYESLKSGEKKFYKPLAIKSMGSYDDPIRISGVKASIVWNALKDPEDETIDLTTRNSIEVVKISLNPKLVEDIKDTYPEVYARANTFFNGQGLNMNPSELKRMQNITAIAIPLDTKVPKWVLEFIDYNTIINDNITNFANILESLGVKMVKGSVNYTNILNF